MKPVEMPRISAPCRLNAVEAGAGDAIVLLHGLGSSQRDWQAQVEELSRTHRVVALDLRGHGQSPRAELGVEVSDLAEDVAATLEALHVKQSHVVGWSLGGLVGTVLAAGHPELVRSLVIVNSPPSSRPSSFRERFL